jgi:hypothetical protein
MSATQEHPELIIFGTTTPAQEDSLPIRLSPVYLRLRDGAVLLPRDEEATDLDQLEPVAASWIEEEQAQGGLVRFEPSLPARPGCWLLQLQAGAPPLLLEPKEARSRVQEAGDRALEEVQQAIAQADYARAERQAWYASRALPQNPLPLVALVWLLRRTGMAEEDITHLEMDLQAFPEEARSRVQRLLEQWVQTRPSRPGQQGQLPPYLVGLEDEPSFLFKARNLIWFQGPMPI